MIRSLLERIIGEAARKTRKTPPCSLADNPSTEHGADRLQKHFGPDLRERLFGFACLIVRLVRYLHTRGPIGVAFSNQQRALRARIALGTTTVDPTRPTAKAGFINTAGALAALGAHREWVLRPGAPPPPCAIEVACLHASPRAHIHPRRFVQTSPLTAECP